MRSWFPLRAWVVKIKCEEKEETTNATRAEESEDSRGPVNQSRDGMKRIVSELNPMGVNWVYGVSRAGVLRSRMVVGPEKKKTEWLGVSPNGR